MLNKINNRVLLGYLTPILFLNGVGLTVYLTTLKISKLQDELQNQYKMLRVDQVQTLTPYFKALNSSMEAQSQKAMKISDSMVQLSEFSSQTTASFREVNGAIAPLNETAQTLQN